MPDPPRCAKGVMDTHPARRAVRAYQPPGTISARSWNGLVLALAAWSLPAFSFALWTFINLSPRAQNHHARPRERFAEHPRERKAAIPYLW
ncbi:MAG: hypothetical protein IPG92_11245 [Flavobacteriales bacterium]|nr:hypothetical protein [Flavobacteriales bacterium]